MSTEDQSYTQRLVPVQAPYRWNLRRLRPGRTLDIGCGLGRNLHHLDGNGVGVDHNATSVEIARSQGLVAYTPEEFAASPDARPASFDTLLFAHILEHLEPAEATSIVESHLPYLKPGGQVVVICPQRRGFASDATHVTFIDFERAEELLGAAGVTVTSKRSFPFPLAFGRVFPYNEYVIVGRR